MTPKETIKEFRKIWGWKGELSGKQITPVHPEILDDMVEWLTTTNITRLDREIEDLRARMNLAKKQSDPAMAVVALTLEKEIEFKKEEREEWLKLKQ